MKTEELILKNLILNKPYFEKVFPFIKPDYFDIYNFQKIFSTLQDFSSKYQKQPSIEALQLLVEKRTDLSDQSHSEIQDILSNLKLDKRTDEEWLISETEKFCKNQALYGAIRESISILEEEKAGNKGNIPKLVSDALAVSFDKSVGHDFLEDYAKRHEFYNREEEKIGFDIEMLSKITDGGFPKKSMIVFLATTGGGKSLVKCHLAANALLSGKNVLYITAELSEERVANRIDANILGMNLKDVKKLSLPELEKKIRHFKEKTTGKLIIKEYPTGAANSNHFRHLINEVRLKKNFVPDIVCLDYLNICASSRIKQYGSVNSYSMVKSIAEEVRGLAMEYNFLLITSSQFNRNAYGSSDVDLQDTSESMGLTHTADAVFGLISSEELEESGKIIMKQLKNRFGDMSINKKFMVGIDRSKMTLYNLDNSTIIGTEIPEQPVEKPNLKTRISKKRSPIVIDEGDIKF